MYLIFMLKYSYWESIYIYSKKFKWMIINVTSPTIVVARIIYYFYNNVKSLS